MCPLSDIPYETYSQPAASKQRGHLSAHASEGECMEYANREILAELKIESVKNNKISFHKSVLYTLGITL